MDKKVLSEKEYELLEILKQRKKIDPERAEDNAVGIILVTEALNNIDEVIAYCNDNPMASLSEILTFTSRDLPELETSDEDDEDHLLIPPTR